MSPENKAVEFARKWAEAWNAHDIDWIMSHYAENIEHTTPMAVRLLNEPSGTIRGKNALQEYFTAALKRVPDLEFEVVDVLAGVNSMVVYYKAIFGKMSAEVLFFDKHGKVTHSYAHYD